MGSRLVSIQRVKQLDGSPYDYWPFEERTTEQVRRGGSVLAAAGVVVDSDHYLVDAADYFWMWFADRSCSR